MKTCEVCGITEEETTVYKGSKYNYSFLCNKHYNQMKSKGFIKDASKPNHTPKKKCDICGDTHKVWIHRGDGELFGKLLCNKHRTQIRANGSIVDETRSHLRNERICSHCGKGDGEIVFHTGSQKMFCRRHYDHMYVYGEVLERTRNDRNEIVKHEDYAEIIIYNMKNIEIARTIIDKECIEKVSKYKWYMGGHGYVCTLDEDGRYLALHQLLMGTKDTNHLVDHKDRNPLNNRVSNLRKANKAINTINTDIRKHNTSGVTGVSFNKQLGKWRAYITNNKKRIELGVFEEKESAIIERLKAEKEFFNEYAPQQHLFKEYDI